MARLINDQHLFIHSAKTGGTFFREALNNFGIPNRELGPKHAGWKELMPEKNEFKSVFGFVRHPVTWYQSRWAYGRMTYFGEKVKYMPEAQRHWMADVWDNDLHKFVENILKIFPYGIAYDYFDSILNISNWKTSGIEIYRYENLIYGTASILSTIGNRAYTIQEVGTMPIVLDSRKVRNANPLSEELIKGIEEVEHKLIKLYY